MSMSVGSADGEEPGIMAVINTTPLVDVMLVLLIIFLITIPVIVPTEEGGAAEGREHPDPDQAREHHGGDRCARRGLLERRAHAGSHAAARPHQGRGGQVPQPELHIRADKETRYEAVGRVIYTIQRGGIVKVGFLTEPDRGIRGRALSSARSIANVNERREFGWRRDV